MQKTYSAAVTYILIAALSSGCASTGIPVLGVRPNQPPVSYSDDIIARCERDEPDKSGANHRDCLYFYNILDWGQDLSDAYRTRATWNEWGLYTAGVVGLAVVGSLAGLAAFNQAGSDAAKIIPLVGGFVSGVSAVFDNKGKAAAYTEAANTIDSALAEARASVKTAEYRPAANTLYGKVTTAKNSLEIKRSTFADVQERLKKAEEEIKQIKENQTSLLPRHNPSQR